MCFTMARAQALTYGPLVYPTRLLLDKGKQTSVLILSFIHSLVRSLSKRMLSAYRMYHVRLVGGVHSLARRMGRADASEV